MIMPLLAIDSNRLHTRQFQFFKICGGSFYTPDRAILCRFKGLERSVYCASVGWTVVSMSTDPVG